MSFHYSRPSRKPVGPHNYSYRVSHNAYHLIPRNTFINGKSAPELLCGNNVDTPLYIATQPPVKHRR